MDIVLVSTEYSFLNGVKVINIDKDNQMNYFSYFHQFINLDVFRYRLQLW